MTASHHRTDTASCTSTPAAAHADRAILQTVNGLTRARCEGAMSAGRRAGDRVASNLSRGARTYAHVLSHAGGTGLAPQPRSDGQSSLRAALYTSPPYALQVPPLPVPRLAVNLTPARVSGGLDTDGARDYDTRRHSLFLIPADAPAAWTKTSPSRHVGLYFDAALLEDRDGASAASRVSERTALFNVVVPGLGPVIDQLAAELQDDTLMTAEAVDSLSRLLLIGLERHLASRTEAPGQRLTAAMLGRLRDYVTAHRGGRILVADLAREADLPPNHFARVFTEQTGQSPHRFVLALRLDRAVHLLAHSSLTLADIAHDCGFSHQQHLSNAIRRYLGTTPARYRTEQRK
jgi:AraC family transcriptional regulator